MREIKFRAWDTKSESMEYEIAIGKGYGEDSYILFLGLGETFIIDDDIVKIMQYTGLKDKNNVEIYESDICRCLGGSEFNGHYEYNRIYEVKWQGSGLEMMIDNCGYGWNYSSGFEYIEVIGNIYENPELLN